ncbi:MAG: C-terminal binding protein [Spirochaetaceae bacterium]|jgi:D-3-phosphoglycerate dehydrogenase|nr:C-terminal binding protein [Spirochaetaceae bacterium]
MKIVISDDRFGWSDEEQRVLRDMNADLFIADCFTEEALIEACADADGILLNQAPMSARVIGTLKKCRVISRYGIGYDNVDLLAAEEQGIWVTNVPGYCTEEVAEHALGLLLAAVRWIPFKDRGVRQGGWNLNRPIRRLSGSVLGIVGFGATGQALWKKVQGLGFSRVLIADPHINAKLSPDMAAEAASFTTLLEEADFISLHVPLNEQTRHCINPGSIGRMKDGAVLVNVSRGQVIDEAALARALASGKIGAAGLDVFESEPLPPEHPFLSLDNVILTDHSAYYSRESVSALKTRAAMNVREVLEGRIPKFAVNRPETRNTRREPEMEYTA